LVASVSGTTGFGFTTYKLNPGLSGTFPWLAPIAEQWQQYAFRKLCFRYVTRCSTATTGSVILSPEYDPNDPSPPSETTASNTQDAVEDAAWREIICVLDPQAMHPLGPRKMIRNGNVVGDLNNYDVGRFSVCTTGMADTSGVGKLWVDYVVDLFVPQNSGSLKTLPRHLSAYNLSSDQALSTGTVETIAFDEFLVSDVTIDPLGITNSSGTFTLPRGSYLVHVLAQVEITSWGAAVSSSAMTVNKNGSAISPPCGSIIVVPWITGQSNAVSWAQPFVYQINSDGDDTTAVRMTVTCTSGTIALGQDGTQITFLTV
jgi:hypothetical protein